MRVNTIMPYLLTAQRRTFTVQQDISGAYHRIYGEKFPVQIRLVTSTQTRPVLYTPVKFETYDFITDIVGIDGTPVIGAAEFYIAAFVPVTNAYGFSDGFAHALKSVPAGGISTAVPETDVPADAAEGTDA